MNALQRFWQARQPRERRVLGLGAGILLIALAYAEIWYPIASKLTQLQHSVPQLRHAAQQLQIDAKQAKALKAQSPVSSNSDIGELLRQSASRHSLNISAPQQDPNGDWQTQLAAADFQSLMAWLAELQKRHGLRVISSQIAAAQTPDSQVSAKISLHAGQP